MSMNANEQAQAQAQALLRLFKGDLDQMDQYQTVTDQLVRSVLAEIAGASRVPLARVIAAFRHGEVGVTEAFCRLLQTEQPGLYAGVYICECWSRFVLVPASPTLQ